MHSSSDKKRGLTVITYGTFDLLHHGHVRLLERAKALGDRLIVGVTSDAFDRERGKLNVVQPMLERAQAVQNLGIADQVIIEEFQGQKISDITKYGVDIFAIGSDWEGKFDYLNSYCKVVYLDRTQGISSTELRKAQAGEDLTLGILGDNYLSYRLIDELAHVSGLRFERLAGFEGDIVSPDNDQFAAPDLGGKRVVFGEKFFEGLDLVYISAPLAQRAQLAHAALTHGCHVLCEAPFAPTLQQTEELFSLAQETGLVLMSALKTKYFPAFERLKLMLESGVIGEIKDIDASFSHVFAHLDTRDPYQGALFDMGAYITLPVSAFIGNKPSDIRLHLLQNQGFCSWAKIDLSFPTASATLRVGRGIKTEGDLTITGTDGYIYVPSPWWLTDYFEIRGEDLRSCRRVYQQFMGGGQRYELAEFIRRIKKADEHLSFHEDHEAAHMVAEILEQSLSGEPHLLQAAPYCFGGGERCTDR